MAARPFGTICSLLFVWLCALGAGATSHPAAHREAIRGAAEVALRDAAEGPLLVSRAPVTSAAHSRNVERDLASRLSWFIGPRRAPAPRIERATQVAVGHQVLAHARRPRWRAYDAAAPPALSRIAR